jgi:hyaluronan synthase
MRPNIPEAGAFTRARILAGVLIAIGVAGWAAVYHLYLGQTGFGGMLLFYLFISAVAVFYIASAVFGPRFTHLPVAERRVVAIIPAFNEEPELLRNAILAMANASRPPDEIHVMDDGSSPAVQPFNHPLVTWHRQANAGKRHAQAAVLGKLNRNDVQFILTVDSDSVLHPRALEHMLRAMSKPKVMGVTGLVLVRNWHDNILTRAQDLDIGTSCLLVRTSRSIFGAVSPTSGALALYRSEILFDNLDDYVASGTNGDDRRLSLYSLLRGHVVTVNEACVDTAMPTGTKGLFRQRMRWGKSGWQSLPFEITNLGLVPLIFRVYALALAVLLPLLYGYILLVTALSGNALAVALAVAATMIIRYGQTSIYSMT